MPPIRKMSDPAEEADTEETQYISVADLDRIIAEKLAERDAAHAAEMEVVRARLPQLMVPMHAGGPGVDNHQQSWSLVEQQHASAGEILDHWKGV